MILFFSSLGYSFFKKSPVKGKRFLDTTAAELLGYLHGAQVLGDMFLGSSSAYAFPLFLVLAETPQLRSGGLSLAPDSLSVTNNAYLELAGTLSVT